ncbi:MAG: iron-sulfur cluster assembly protein [Pseudomonadota bacterium]
MTATTPSRAAVDAALSRVMDPELDESITEMGFVEGVEIKGGAVTVLFRLPTYWCSPNFAFLMVEDIHAALRPVPGVTQVDVTLLDHLYAQEITDAVRDGRSFADAIGEDLAGDSLDEVRRTFEDKAFQRRQEAVLLDLKRQGMSDADIVAATLGDFDGFTFEDADAKTRAPLYRELLLHKGLAKRANDPAFVTLEGAPIPPDGLWGHLQTLRQVRINMEFGGALCRGLKTHRYKEATRQDGKLTLVDFLPEASVREPQS